MKDYRKSYSYDASLHTQGLTTYLDDIPEMKGTLYARVFYSNVANGKIVSIQTTSASILPGVVKIINHLDIPGDNQIGGIIADEPLLANDHVHFIGQPILIVVAEDPVIAYKALELIKVEIEEDEVIVDPRKAFEMGNLLSPPRCFQMGDIDKAFKECEYVIEGKVESGGQEHVYLEPQGSYTIPQDNQNFKIFSSTQGPTAVQRTVSKILGLPMNKIEVDVNRIGGGFGGKEDQASPWAAITALASFLTKRPVKYILSRGEDMQMTGKRNPYSSDYKIGFNRKWKIKAFEVTYFQNGGAAADLSPAILERTLFHATNAYYVPNAKLTAYSCRTNLPPNTAFRGFGGPQGMFVIESAIHNAAQTFGVKPERIQKINLLKDGDEFPYGQVVAQCEARSTWNIAVKDYDLGHLKKEVDRFNVENKYTKKGLALMPICFGISFTNTMMNNARALVHVYSDGSIGISTGAVEMGQGVSSKMIQVAAREFGLGTDYIKLESTNTTRVANTSPSAASATSDLNGKALQNACSQIKERLIRLARNHKKLKKEQSLSFKHGRLESKNGKHSIKWNELINLAFMNRVNLSAKGHYATPVIHFDKKKEKGHPFAYHVYGTAIFSCTVDCIRGNYDMDEVHIIHDFGKTMNPAIDLGQVEGGLIQGMGWMTLEDLLYDEKGRLMSHSLANYKIPDIHFTPDIINVRQLNTKGSKLAILKSKAVGEPPLMYGIGAYFALYNAILAYNPKAKIPYSAPMTTEKILMGLYS